MKYKIASISGSTRFRDEILKVYNDLTEKGYIVLADLTDHSRQGVFDKEMIDDMHREKIKMADLVFVVNPKGYIGESTRNEIKFATQLGKTIEYLDKEN